MLKKMREKYRTNNLFADFYICVVCEGARDAAFPRPINKNTLPPFFHYYSNYINAFFSVITE